MAQGSKLAKVKKLLEAKRQELLEGVNRAREMGAVEAEAGAPDIADRATSAFQREFSFSLSENEGKMLRLIDEALPGCPTVSTDCARTVSSRSNRPDCWRSPGRATASPVRNSRTAASSDRVLRREAGIPIGTIARVTST